MALFLCAFAPKPLALNLVNTRREANFFGLSIFVN